MTEKDTDRNKDVFSREGASARLYRDAPSFEGRRTAAVGDWRCADLLSGADLLNAIVLKAEEEGFQALLGPMDGDTWGSYRLTVETDGSPAFPLEPDTRLENLAAFRVAGFSPIQDYVSTRLDLGGLTAISAEEESEASGTRVGFWDGRNPERLLDRLHVLSLQAFAQNPFFRPIDRAAFGALYAPILPMIDPRFVVVAEQGETMAGFLFGYPNFSEGLHPESAVIKTYASLERGLGRRMADVFHRRARDMGFRFAIHALMREDNRSRGSSGRYGAKVFRRYALMGRLL